MFSHNWAPRIGVIVDPTGNRKSKFFANWGRFYEKITLDMAVRSFSFETSADNGYYKDPGPGQPVDLSPSNYIPWRRAVMRRCCLAVRCSRRMYMLGPGRNIRTKSWPASNMSSKAA